MVALFLKSIDLIFKNQENSKLCLASLEKSKDLAILSYSIGFDTTVFWSCFTLVTATAFCFPYQDSLTFDLGLGKFKFEIFC
jgi:hypothetical protein